MSQLYIKLLSIIIWSQWLSCVFDYFVQFLQLLLKIIFFKIVQNKIFQIKSIKAVSVASQEPLLHYNAAKQHAVCS